MTCEVLVRGLLGGVGGSDDGDGKVRGFTFRLLVMRIFLLGEKGGMIY